MSSTSSTETPLDSLGMLAAAAALPEQVAAVLGESWGYTNLPEHDEVEHVVVIGMGGSGIAGEVLASAAGPYMPVPVMVFKSYNVPAFLGEGSLVFAVSFSGDTEETVEAATEAALQGAKVVAVTTGGQLGDLAEAWGSPIVRVPESIPQPRAAIGALAVPAMLVLEEIGLFPGARHWVEAAVEQLGKRRDELVQPGSQAEVLARSIGRTIPLIHGGGGLGAVAAHRWKTQMNENAKVPAFWNAQPEVCHNEIAGWGQHGDLTRQAFTLVNLRHDFEHPQVMHRFGITREVLDEVVADICDVHAEGDGELAQLLDLVMVGDFASTHLALQQGVDPGPVPTIDDIKTALATSAGQDPSAEGALSS
jgi:glucose/mannose-6-phosphate isomerase